MPWCGPCDRFLSPSPVSPDGTCPRCGAVVDPGAAHPTPAPAAEPPASPAAAPVPVGAPTADPEADAPIPLPWHFKLMVGAVALYLGWRAFQGVEWIVRQL